MAERYSVSLIAYEPSTFYDGDEALGDEEVCDRLNSQVAALADAVEALRKIRMSRPAGNAAAYRKRVAEAFFAAHPEQAKPSSPSTGP